MKAAQRIEIYGFRPFHIAQVEEKRTVGEAVELIAVFDEHANGKGDQEVFFVVAA